MQLLTALSIFDSSGSACYINGDFRLCITDVPAPMPMLFEVSLTYRDGFYYHAIERIYGMVVK